MLETLATCHSESSVCSWPCCQSAQMTSCQLGRAHQALFSNVVHVFVMQAHASKKDLSSWACRVEISSSEFLRGPEVTSSDAWYHRWFMGSWPSHLNLIWKIGSKCISHFQGCLGMAYTWKTVALKTAVVWKKYSAPEHEVNVPWLINPLFHSPQNGVAFYC